MCKACSMRFSQYVKEYGYLPGTYGYTKAHREFSDVWHVQEHAQNPDFRVVFNTTLNVDNDG